MRKRLGIDIDGTLTCPSSFVPYINESFNMNITLDDLKQYELSPLIGISNEEFWEWMDKMEPEIYKSNPLSTGAKTIMDQWKDQYDLYFISARRQHLYDVTHTWFANQKIDFDHLELIGSHNKIATVKKHNIDLFFEDKHDNACDISEECDIPVILFDTPYNRMPIPKSVIRVNDWYEAEKWVSNFLSVKNY